MKQFSILLIFMMSLFVTDCKKDAKLISRDYPFVVTLKPVISEEGAVLSAEILELGTQNILAFGFVWDKDVLPTISDSRILFDREAERGIYSYELTGGLGESRYYNCRAYILTDENEIYGNMIAFKSMGSLPPEITNFEPKVGSTGTKVVIDGKNFALSELDNIVKFKDTEAVIDSVAENQIFVTVPNIGSSESVQISVETAGLKCISEDLFDFQFP